VDPTEWEVRDWESSSYQVTMRLRHRQIIPAGDGTERIIRLDDVPETRTMFRIRARFRRLLGASAIKEIAAGLIADIQAAALRVAPTAPPRRREPGTGHLLVIHAPDVHLGKVPADGSDWDAAEAHHAAVTDLLSKAGWVDTSRILLAIGNDALNTDGSRRTTTRGTPQDTAGRWRDEFRAAVSMYRRAIDAALDVAPVHAVIVPGNHDGDAVFYLGEVLAAVYAANTHVTFDNTSAPRRYHLHGRCLLGLTHGETVKLSELPRLMSEEVPDLWAQATAAREWLTGHRHRLEVQTVGSCVIRTSDALSPTDEWHAGRGYVGVRRAAEALIYHPEAGRVGVFSAPLSDVYRPAA
jgi:hypothetical protein